MPAIVNANLFAVASMFISTEQTRYYLRGVLVQKHQTKGVYLVATDGHRLMCVYDENGSSTLDDVIVRLDKAAISACKADRREPLDRKLHIDGDGTVTVMTSDDAALSTFRNCVVDGTFPDWRRVVPSSCSGECTSGFDAAHVADFGKASAALQGNKNHHIRIAPNGEGPALIRFPAAHAFGVLMPVGCQNETTLPDFYTEPALQIAAE